VEMTSKPAHAPGENRPLTSIRGVAASWVFVAHVSAQFYTLLPGRVADGMMCGWEGVDIFFVLSGFIIATVYHDLRPGGWGRFWTRRIFRVFPLNVFVVGGLALAELAGVRTGAVVDWPDLPYHLLMLQSFVPGHKPGWIFVNWSVGIELICYIAFPLSAIALRLLGTRALAALVVLLAAGTWWAQTQALAQFFGLLAVERCGSEFLLGAGLGALALRLPRLPAAVAGLLELAGCGLIVFAAGSGIDAKWCVAFGSPRMALLPLGAGVLIFALASDSGPAARLLRLAPLLWLGRISFSIYLIHVRILVRTSPLLWLLVGGPPGMAAVLVWGVAMYAVTTAVAFVTYFLVERPGRRLGNALLTLAARRRGTPGLAWSPSAPGHPHGTPEILVQPARDR